MLLCITFSSVEIVSSRFLCKTIRVSSSFWRFSRNSENRVSKASPSDVALLLGLCTAHSRSLSRPSSRPLSSVASVIPSVYNTRKSDLRRLTIVWT